jgi:RNA polymerase sigma-70 factor (ECF subfamily)
MKPMAETDRRMIERARQGDVAAQQTLWKQHRRWVAAIVLAHRPRTIEVEDLMQDVAVRMVSKLRTLRDPDAFRPWLRQIIINVCRGAARSLRPTLRLVNGDRDDDGPDATRAATPANDDPGAHDATAQRDTVQRVMQQVRSLPSEYREPLLLRCVRSMTYQQISAVLDLPVTTIETRLARARRMLREELDALDTMEGSA